MKAMNTPIHDFIKNYIESGTARLHVPGHKGAGPTGFEPWDITEIAGADELYGACGIIAESERNAAGLFGSGATFYSCEGSSLCIRAMLYLALSNRAPSKSRPVALAARNAHKAFLYAAALCDFDVEWLYPDGSDLSLCACPVAPEALARRLDAMADVPFCVYVTSPDYLGGMQDIRGLSQVCHARGVPLLVDDAHGAYLKFLTPSLHPIDLGADMCCDSAHKTLPVLTGGAYLHVSKDADPRYIDGAKDALSMFGSTSPSWLILQSLDLCNRYLCDRPFDAAVSRVDALKRTLSGRGFALYGSEPMKLTLRGDGMTLAEELRAGGVECEFADREFVVLMPSPQSTETDFERISDILQKPRPYLGPPSPALPKGQKVMTVREAMFAPSEVVPVFDAVGRVCAAPTVSCPPAVPVAVSGEVVTPEVIEALRFYGVARVRVCK